MLGAHRKSDEVIIITGGSSGVGKALAMELSKPGTKIYLLGQSSERLDDAVRACGKKGAHVIGKLLDVCDRELSEEFMESCFNEGQLVDQFYDCAVRAFCDEVRDLEISDWDWIMEESLYSNLHWSGYIYQKMVEQKKGRIVLFSSLAGILCYPGFAGYAASKKALLVFYKSLKMEASMHGVNMHVVCSGYIHTNIFKGARCKKTDVSKIDRVIPFKFISAESAATKILKGISGNKGLIIFPFYGRVINWMNSFAPWLLGSVYKETIRSIRSIRRP